MLKRDESCFLRLDDAHQIFPGEILVADFAGAADVERDVAEAGRVLLVRDDELRGTVRRDDLDRPGLRAGRRAVCADGDVGLVPVVHLQRGTATGGAADLRASRGRCCGGGRAPGATGSGRRCGRGRNWSGRCLSRRRSTCTSATRAATGRSCAAATAAARRRQLFTRQFLAGRVERDGVRARCRRRSSTRRRPSCRRRASSVRAAARPTCTRRCTCNSCRAARPGSSCP